MITVLTRREGVSFLRGTVAFGAIGAAERALFKNPPAIAEAAIESVIVLALGLAFVELFRRNRRVTREANAITVRSWLRLTWTIDVSAVNAAKFVPRYKGARGEASRLVLRDASGARLLRLDSLFWEPSGVAELAWSLPAVLEVVPEGMSGKELIRRFPQAASFSEEHPLRAWGIFVGALVVLLAAFAGFVLVFVAR